MAYKKYDEQIPFKIGDVVEFYQQTWRCGGVLRKGAVMRIDENGFEYNLHVKCEYASPLGRGAVVYPLRQDVRIVEE